MNKKEYAALCWPHSEQMQKYIELPEESTEADTIALLKQHAFKWSPRFKAWQRILTPMARSAER